MGKKLKTSRPTQDTLNTFKDIEKYITNEQNEKKKKFSFPQKKVKMPFKMYMGIKNSVIKKQKKEEEFNKANDIIAQTNKKQKMMTQFVLSKLEKKKEEKNYKKLMISRNKAKSRYKDGVMNVGKHFQKRLKEKDN